MHTKSQDIYDGNTKQLLYFCSSHKKLELLTSKVDMIRQIFKGIILGSGINWAANEHLRELTINLGRPLDEVISEN